MGQEWRQKRQWDRDGFRLSLGSRVKRTSSGSAWAVWDKEGNKGWLQIFGLNNCLRGKIPELTQETHCNCWQGKQMWWSNPYYDTLIISKPAPKRTLRYLKTFILRNCGEFKRGLVLGKLFKSCSPRGWKYHSTHSQTLLKTDIRRMNVNFENHNQVYYSGSQ